MAAPSSPLRPYRFLIMLGGMVLVTATLYWAQKILIPLALAVLLAFVLNPVVTVVQRRWLGRVPSVILVTCLSFLLLGGIGLSLTLQVKRLGAELPQYKENVVKKLAGLREVSQGRWLQDLEEMLREPSTGDSERGKANKGIPEQPVAVRMEPASAFTFDRVAGPTAEFLATAGLVVVLVVFMLIQREELRNRLIQLFGQGRLIHTTRAFEEAARSLSRFLLMQLVINTGYGLTLGLGLYLIGVPYPLLWGILSATLRFVPYVGTWLTIGLNPSLQCQRAPQMPPGMSALKCRHFEEARIRRMASSAGIQREEVSHGESAQNGSDRCNSFLESPVLVEPAGRPRIGRGPGDRRPSGCGQMPPKRPWRRTEAPVEANAAKAAHGAERAPADSNAAKAPIGSATTERSRTRP